MLNTKHKSVKLNFKFTSKFLIEIYDDINTKAKPSGLNEHAANRALAKNH